MADTAPQATSASELREVLTRSPVPLALLDLDTLELVDANAAAAKVIGRDLPIVEPVALGTLLSPDDAEHAAHALQLVADGTIHSYSANRKVLRPDGGVVDGDVWVRSIAHFRHAMALLVFMPERPGDGRANIDDVEDVTAPSMPIAFTDPIAVGTMEIDTRIVRIERGDRKAHR